MFDAKTAKKLQHIQRFSRFEAKAEIDNETCKDTVKREGQKRTKKRNKNKRMSRCEDSPE